MQDFKDKKALRAQDGDDDMPVLKERSSAHQAMLKLNVQRPGWYEGTLNFKRVQMSPGTGKFQYRDTIFVAQVKAMSPQDCYNRIVEHLRSRVDERSQFPSPKGKNYTYRYLGAAK